jgi:hypothetical protein
MINSHKHKQSTELMRLVYKYKSKNMSSVKIIKNIRDITEL